jgi:hypothetical protein
MVSVVAIALLLVSIVLIGFRDPTVVVLVEGVSSADPFFPLVLAGYVVSTGLLAWLGAVLSNKVAANPIGRILLALGAWQAVTLFVSVALIGSVSLRELGWWLATWTFVPMITIPAAVVLLLFPVGRLPSPRWRPFVWISLIGTASWILAEMTRPILGLTDLANPYANRRLETAGDIVSVIMVASLVAAARSVIVRFRQARTEERLQLKWITYAGLFMLLTWGVIWILADVATASFGAREIAAGTLTLALFFGAIAAAMLKYRLYDIERLISRTLSYALVVGLLAVVYAAVAVGLPQMFGWANNSSLATAAGTLAVAALFRPVTTRLHQVMDRRFNRTRFDAQIEMDGFASSLGRLDLEGVVTSLNSVVTRTVAPDAIGVWIR